MEVLKTDKLDPSKRLICMVGLPYSGKSTKAKQLGYPIVNPDSIRVALHGHKFIQEAEPYVWAIAKTMVRSLFLSGHDTVILDATNTTENRRKEWLSKEWTTYFECVKTTVHKCIERAVMIGDDGMIPIINSMAKKITFPLEFNGSILEVMPPIAKPK